MPDQPPSLSSQALILEHLKMLQPIIDRMNRSSFQCKAWSAGLVAAVLAAAASTKPWVGFFVFAPAIVFWALDAYYLWVERGFRRLFEAVRDGEEKQAFCMDFQKHLREGEDDYGMILCNPTVAPVHGMIIFGALVTLWAANGFAGWCG